jgi:hypothetical protein
LPLSILWSRSARSFSLDLQAGWGLHSPKSIQGTVYVLHGMMYSEIWKQYTDEFWTKLTESNGFRKEKTLNDNTL